MQTKFDAVMIVSFGGPEKMADVMPFLENVLAGKNVPEARKMEVARHYEMFGGVSPINAHNRELKSLLEKKLIEDGIKLPVFWGNRNWKPYIHDALGEMKAEGIKSALAYVTSAFGSYSGCRQYRDDIEKARVELGEGVPSVHKIRSFFNHPDFIRANVKRIQEEMEKILVSDREKTHLVFTAHSIPVSMSQVSPYLQQLLESCRLVAEELKISHWKLVFQSRSGPPTVPWLEPDICDYLKELAQKNVKNVIVAPIGFLSDHMEVIYDLDVEAKNRASDLGINMFRAKSAGNHPLMIEMIVDLIKERLMDDPLKKSLGSMGCSPDTCAPDCCQKPS